MISKSPSSVCKSQHLPGSTNNELCLVISDHEPTDGNISIYVCLSSKQTDLAFYDTLIGFTGDVNLVHSSTQVVEEESPVARSQVHLARLSGFGGALLWPLVQQDTSFDFIFSILSRQSVDQTLW